jgi:hypothetical protein
MDTGDTFEERALAAKSGEAGFFEMEKSVDPILVWLGMFATGEQVSSAHIAKAAELSDKKINEWVNGSSSPKIEEIRAAVNTLGYDIRIVKIDNNPICKTPKDKVPLFPQELINPETVQ